MNPAFETIFSFCTLLHRDTSVGDVSKVISEGENSDSLSNTASFKLTTLSVRIDTTMHTRVNVSLLIGGY